MNKAEIIIYQPEDLTLVFDVRVEDETVWLTQIQMADLFQTTRNNITIHIGNIFKEKELEEISVGKDSLLAARDGKKYHTKFYNLDVIISVGYRVKSQRGTQFRIWANRVLREFLLKGHVLNQRVDRIESKLIDHDQKFDMLIKTNLPPTEGIFYDGQIFDAYAFVANLIKSAKKSIILIDNYVDETVLILLSKRSDKVSAMIYTKNISKQLGLDLKKHNEQYPSIEIKEFTKSHDRFLIIDEKTIYHIGASLKDLGNKWFAFSRIKLNAKDLIDNLNR
ncbi:MAG: DNA-binding protein [Candidatus Marinimicrobia bacterium]|nr:DNA-binding protein [Candidatus Neomarinimicrobiota bacterium]